MPFPIQQQAKEQIQTPQSSGALAGTNEKTPLQLLNAAQALLIQNYFMRQPGVAERRRGSKKLAEVVGNTSSSRVWFKWTDNVYLLGYGTVLAAYNVTAKTITTIKSNFNTNLQDGIRYGAYAFTCTGKGEKIYRTSQILNYDGQTGNFTAGLVVTGTTSGATALIIKDVDGGVTGVLTLDSLSGTFIDNEAITDTSTGAAVVNGANTYATEEIAAAPYCNKLMIWENRLLAGDIVRGAKTSRDEIIASQENTDGTVPYFDGWTAGAGATSGFIITFPRAGQLTGMCTSDVASQAAVTQQLFITYKNGWLACHREVTNDGTGTVVQAIRKDYERLNAGGDGRMIHTPYGIFLGNETGEFLVRTDGTWRNLSETWSQLRILNLDQTNSDRVYLPDYNVVLTTTRDDSDTNNVIYWFDVRTLDSPQVSWGTLTGWSISRFLLDGQTLFGATDTSPKVLELFATNVYDDEGSDVYTAYRQPLNLGKPSILGATTVKDVRRTDVAGYLTPGNPIQVDIDGVSEGGSYQSGVISFQWEASEDATSGESGLGYSGLGYGGYGDPGTIAPGTVWWPAYSESQQAYGYASYIANFTAHDKAPHTISLIALQVNEFRPQRTNLLTPTT